MKIREIILTIDEQGGISAETEGFTGESCLEVLDELLIDEGLHASTEKKPEYYQQTKSKVKSTNSIRRRGK